MYKKTNKTKNYPLKMYTLSLNVNIKTLNGYVLVVFISAHPYLDIISGGLWQLLVEPWRSVEHTAISTKWTTTSTIPDRISKIEPQEGITIVFRTARIAEIVLTHKRRDNIIRITRRHILTSGWRRACWLA